MNLQKLHERWARLEKAYPGLFLNPAIASGEYTVGRVYPDGGFTPLFTKPNLLLYSWGFIAAKCIGQGDTDYKVNAAYLEYANVAAPGDPVSIPSTARDDDLSYYDSLPADRDFLRVSLTGTPAIDIATGFESYFIGGVSGNRVTFVLQSTGTIGVLGTPFSDVNNSKACGIALVATPEVSDRSKDVILARGYFDVGDQPLKAAGSQIGVNWSISFK